MALIFAIFPSTSFSSESHLLHNHHIQTDCFGDGLPLFIMDSQSPTYCQFYKQIRAIEESRSRSQFEITKKVALTLPKQLIQNDPIVVGLILLLARINEDESLGKNSEIYTRLNKHITKDSNTYFFKQALLSSDKKVHYALKYLGTHFDKQIDFATNIQNNLHKDEKYSDASLYYFANMNHEAVMQTYYFVTLLEKQNSIKNNKSLALSLLLLATAYKDEKRFAMYNRLVSKIIPNLEMEELIPVYTLQANGKTYISD